MNAKREVGCKQRFRLSNYAWKLCAYITTCTLSMSSYSVISVNAAKTDDLPYFADTLNNVTVPVGREATFQCIVRNLKKGYQVAWFHKDKHTLLALHDTVIFRSGRLSVSSHAGTTFYLHISSIREEDRGEYMCQINTDPMLSQVGFLHVVVPPRFLEEMTSSDTEVREDSSVSLRCSASGFPKPEIKWRREDGQAINMQSNGGNKIIKKATSINGEYLNLTKVTRLHMGAYICIASNGIPPAVSKRIFLGINFSPLIWPPNQLIGAPLGSDVTLECNLESHPQSSTYWTKNTDQAIIHPNAKYNTYIEPTNSPYRMEMRLKIIDLKASDYGTYACVAKNILGEVQATIKLFETPKPSTNSDLVPLPVKESNNARKKNYYGTKSSVAFDEGGGGGWSQTGERNLNKAIVLTEVLGYEITSEHITLQSEDRVTLNSHNHHSDGSVNIKCLAMVFIGSLSISIWFSIGLKFNQGLNY